MKILKYWLIIVSMMLSISATAGMSDLGTQSSYLEQQYTPVISTDFAALIVRTEQHKKKPVFIEQTTRANTHRSVLFLADGQVEPSFKLEFEFFPPDLANERYNVSTLNAKPWFLQSSAGRSRVSGWKDGNSLYTASITYHS